MSISLQQVQPFVIAYNLKSYDFVKLICEMLCTHDLTKLHLQGNYELLDRKHDQSTHWHRLYYEQFGKINPLYLAFLSEHIMPLFGIPVGELVYQKIPTFRIHLIGNVSVGEWHRDSAYNHDESETNIWLPFVNTYDTNTVWIESEEGKADYSSYPVKYGEALIFNGAKLTHGNKINQTPDTRVSIDFRVVKLSDFHPSERCSINAGVKFSIGGYFSVM